MKNKGFSLLFSILFIAAALSVSLGISGLVLGRIRLSGIGRDSQIAFYAADSAAECVIYWDIYWISEIKFSTSSPSTITCAGQSRSVGGGLVSSFSLDFDNGSCATIDVDKTDPNLTIVTSIGRSPCAGVKRVERGLEVRY
ncbi:MAG: hypothetical protein AAB474_02045 [Patescibacteria group bacterium]